MCSLCSQWLRTLLLTTSCFSAPHLCSHPRSVQCFKFTGTSCFYPPRCCSVVRPSALCDPSPAPTRLVAAGPPGPAQRAQPLLTASRGSRPPGGQVCAPCSRGYCPRSYPGEVPPRVGLPALGEHLSLQPNLWLRACYTLSTQQVFVKSVNYLSDEKNLFTFLGAHFLICGMERSYSISNFFFSSAFLRLSERRCRCARLSSMLEGVHQYETSH